MMYFYPYGQSNLGYYIVLFTIAIVLVFTIPNISGQTIKNQNGQEQTGTIGWDKIITLIAATGIISAVGTGLFNRYNTNKQLEKQQANTLKQIEKQQENSISMLDAQLKNTLKQMKYDMQVKELQEKLNLYSTFAFNLKRLRELLRKEQNSSNLVSEEQVNPIKHEIEQLIGPKFYLLAPEVVAGWLEINKNYYNLNSIQPLIDKLKDEYNVVILVKYKELTGSELGQLED